MNQVLLIAHVVVSFCIIGLVMMQQGKGADAGAAFGGGSGGASGSLFGASGAGTFLSRTTAIFAVVFFCTSLGLAFLSGHREVSVDLMDVDPMVIEQESDVPAIDGAAQQTSEDMPQIIDQDIPQPIQDTTVNDIPAAVEPMMENAVTEAMSNEVMSNVETVVDQAQEKVNDGISTMESAMEQVDQTISNEMPSSNSDEASAPSN